MQGGSFVEEKSTVNMTSRYGSPAFAFTFEIKA